LRPLITKHYQGLEEAVYRNIDASRQLAQVTKTSFGPNGNFKAKKTLLNIRRNEQDDNQPFGEALRHE
jgi:hypothetical protein